MEEDEEYDDDVMSVISKSHVGYVGLVETTAPSCHLLIPNNKDDDKTITLADFSYVKKMDLSLLHMRWDLMITPLRIMKVPVLTVRWNPSPDPLCLGLQK